MLNLMDDPVLKTPSVFKRFRNYISSASYSRTIGIIALLIVIAAIPLTVFISQKQQEIRQRASETDNYYCATACPPNQGASGFNCTNEGDVCSGTTQQCCKKITTTTPTTKVPTTETCGVTYSTLIGCQGCATRATSTATNTTGFCKDAGGGKYTCCTKEMVPGGGNTGAPTNQNSPKSTCSGTSTTSTGETLTFKCDGVCTTGWLAAYNSKDTVCAEKGETCCYAKTTPPCNTNIACDANTCVANDPTKCGANTGKSVNCKYTGYFSGTGSVTYNCTKTNVPSDKVLTCNYNCDTAKGEACVGGKCTGGTTDTTTPECTGNQTKTPFQCVGTTCQRVNTTTCQSNSCNSSDSRSCGGTTTCTSPNSNPHYECVNNTCQQVNTCAQNSSGCTQAGGSCGTTGGNTILTFDIGLDGIGSVGDNLNPDAKDSTKNPLRTIRKLFVSVFDRTNQAKVDKKETQLAYASTTGRFTGSVNLGSFASDDYTVKIKSEGFLRRLIPGIQSLKSGSNAMTQVNLVNGDINNDNAINILDYNIFISCSSFTSVTSRDPALCDSNANFKTLSDLYDDGTVDKFDYNLFLREYSVQNGD